MDTWTWGGGRGGCYLHSPALYDLLPFPRVSQSPPRCFPSFFWGFRGLPIWGSLDLHIPNRPVAPGVIALHPLHRP